MSQYSIYIVVSPKDTPNVSIFFTIGIRNMFNFCLNECLDLEHVQFGSDKACG
jgi:hypothetical protein